MLIEEIKQHFLLPIEVNPHKKEIFKNLNEDLELLSSQQSDEGSESVYEQIFKPKTELSRNNLEQWSKYYTTDIYFLKDTQTLLQKYKAVDFKKEIIEDWWNKWREIKEGCRNCRHAMKKHGYDYVPEDWNLEKMKWENHIWKN